MESFYKGYAPTKNKRAVIEFKDVPASDLLTLDVARKFKEYAGILEDNVVLIDIDDREQANILLNIVKSKNIGCRVVATSRGMHFLFKNNGEMLNNRTHCKLAIGLTADIKGCGKASYEVLKVEGKEREIMYDQKPYKEVPKWLMPIRSKVELLNMVEGEGRNSALFSYILPLQQNNFTVDECRECIRIINEFILKEPLAEEELKTVLRDGAFNKPCFFNARGGFQFDVFARYLQRTYNVVKINGKLHVYKDGYYQSGDNHIEVAMIKEIPTLNQSKRKEVLSYLDLIVPNTGTMADAHLIAFKNGVLNITTLEMYDFSPEYLITNLIPFDYYSEAHSELLDKTMKKLACGDENIEHLLYQAIGYSIYRRNELRKSFLLIGKKRNGKSTFLDMVGTLLGEQNIANLDLSEIGDKFKTAELTGKLANIGDDINDEFIPNSAVFKKVVSGNKVTVERKGQDPFVLESYAKFFFSANSLPRIGRGKDSAAILDRLVIIPFDAKFSKDEPDYDPFIKYKLRDKSVIEALIAKAVMALRDVLAEQEFITCDKITKNMADYERTNNPVVMFFDELEEMDYLHEPMKEVYKTYSTFCLANNLQPISSIEFSRQMKEHFGLVVKEQIIDKKRVRIYERENGG